MMQVEYKVHEELAGMHRRLSKEERDQLEANILEDGKIIDAITVWRGFLLDGTNRLEIAEKHGIPYEVVEIELPDIEAAKEWVLRHQLGRRNIAEHEMRRLRAELATMTGDIGGVAVAHGVSRRTVERDVESERYKQELPEDLLERCNKGNLVASRRDLKDYSELTPSQRKSVDQTLRDNPTLRLGQALPHIKLDLSAEDFKVLNTCPHLKSKRQSFALGTLHADKKSIEKYKAMDDVDKEMVAQLLDDPEIDSLHDAILNLSGNIAPPDDEKKLEKLKGDVRKAFDKLLNLMDDIRAIKADKSGHDNCISRIKDAMEAWEAWR